MSTIIVIGTPFSGLEAIWQLVNAAGTTQAALSRKHNLSPIEINQKLIAMLGGSSSGEAAISGQVTPPELWQDLFLDLVLSNAETPCWGWADSQALCFADYWLRINPKAQFILVYDNPGVEAVASTQGEVSPGVLEKAAGAWLAYNSALLAFYSANKDRCLLVHGQRVNQSPTLFLNKLNPLLQADLPPVAPITAAQPISKKTDLIAYILCGGLFEPGTEIRAVYEQLQASADLPFDDLEQQNYLAALNSYQTTVRESASNLAQLNGNQSAARENTLLLIQLHQVQEELERYYLQNEELRKQLKGAPPSKTVAKKSKGNRNAQLYGAAERVKKQLSYRLGATMLANTKSLGGILTMPWALAKEARSFKHEQLKRAGERLPPLSAYADGHQADKVKQHLSYRLGATLLAHSKSPIGWLTLPFALQKEVRTFDRNNKGR